MGTGTGTAETGLLTWLKGILPEVKVKVGTGLARCRGGVEASCAGVSPPKVPLGVGL